MFSNNNLPEQTKVVAELIKGILDGVEMENYTVKVELAPELCQVVVKLTEKNSVTYLRTVSKEVRALFHASDYVFIKFLYEGKMVYKATNEGEELAEEWSR